MALKIQPGILFVDWHNIFDVIPHIPPEPDPDSIIPIATTVAANFPSNDNSTDDGYDPQDDPDDDSSKNSSIDNSIVFDADFPNSNGDDEITGVDQYKNIVDNDDANLFPFSRWISGWSMRSQLSDHGFDSFPN